MNRQTRLKMIARIDALTSERNEARKQRDTFKGKAEENASALAVCEEKIRLLLDRGLCDRIRNALPWVKTDPVDL